MLIYTLDQVKYLTSPKNLHIIIQPAIRILSLHLCVSPPYIYVLHPTPIMWVALLAAIPRSIFSTGGFFCLFLCLCLCYMLCYIFRYIQCFTWCLSHCYIPWYPGHNHLLSSPSGCMYTNPVLSVFFVAFFEYDILYTGKRKTHKKCIRHVHFSLSITSLFYLQKACR